MVEGLILGFVVVGFGDGEIKFFLGFTKAFPQCKWLLVSKRSNFQKIFLPNVVEMCRFPYFVSPQIGCGSIPSDF